MSRTAAWFARHSMIIRWRASGRKQWRRTRTREHQTSPRPVDYNSPTLLDFRRHSRCLLRSGLRVKSTASHYNAFYAMQKLDDPVLHPLAVSFDELRATRHESIYEPDEDETEITRRSVEAVKSLEKALPAIRGWLGRTRGSLARLLADVPS